MGALIVYELQELSQNQLEKLRRKNNTVLKLSLKADVSVPTYCFCLESHTCITSACTSCTIHHFTTAKKEVPSSNLTIFQFNKTTLKVIMGTKISLEILLTFCFLNMIQFSSKNTIDLKKDFKITFESIKFLLKPTKLRTQLT